MLATYRKKTSCNIALTLKLSFSIIDNNIVFHIRLQRYFLRSSKALKSAQN